MNADRLFYSLLGGSLLAHATLAMVLEAIPIKPAQFAVETQELALDVAFVDWVEPPAPQPVVEPAPPALPPEPAAEPVPEPVAEPSPVPEPAIPAPLVALSPQSPVAAAEPVDATVVMIAKPDYLRNPAPPYPRVARQRGWQGTTQLRVEVLADGRPGQIQIIDGAGYVLLDEVAVQAVRQWKFLPARRGDLPIDSWVEVPIVFRLQRAEEARQFAERGGGS